MNADHPKQDHPPTYWDYLGLDKLLRLQGGLDGDEAQLMPDELHFIIVHQSYELWFKLILRELRLARDHLAASLVPEETIPHVVHHLGRVNAILRLCVDQMAVMETLTPQDFLDFRDKLFPSSGFQSFQLREVEILLGLRDDLRADSGFGDPLRFIQKLADGSPGGAFAWGRIEAARAEQSLRDALHGWLHRTPIRGSVPSDDGDDVAVDRFIAEYLASSEALHEEQAETHAAVGVMDRDAAKQKYGKLDIAARAFLGAEDVADGERPRIRRIRAALVFIESYRELPLLAWPRLLVDTVVELEQQLLIFRGRHARMVERMIGRRPGTGGSAGVDYLDKTTKYRIFTELWAVRTLLLPRRALPPLGDTTRYGFSAG